MPRMLHEHAQQPAPAPTAGVTLVQFAAVAVLVAAVLVAMTVYAARLSQRAAHESLTAGVDRPAVVMPGQEQGADHVIE